MHSLQVVETKQTKKLNQFQHKKGSKIKSSQELRKPTSMPSQGLKASQKKVDSQRFFRDIVSPIIAVTKNFFFHY